MIKTNLHDWEGYFSRFGEYPTESSILLCYDIELGYAKVEFSEVLIEDKVLIDVTDTCQFKTATGIQRVVRSLITQLRKQNRDFLLVSWDSNEKFMRTLSPNEEKVAYGEDLSVGNAPEVGLTDPDEFDVIMPRNCLIFVPELAGQTGRIQRLSALAVFSSNVLITMAHDAAPIVVPETTSLGTPGAFAFQTQIWTRSREVIAISESTAREISDLFSSISQRNLRPLTVTSIPLPVCAPSEAISQKAVWPSRSDPTVLVVGTHEPRKNHLRVLGAAEELWKEGLKFHLTFIGSYGWRSEDFWEKFASLKQDGRRLEEFHGLSDLELCRAYSDATCLLFPSLHEGFGLPIAEAVSFGLPVITSDVGSMKDLADEYGLTQVDPNSIDDISNALRKLLMKNVKKEIPRNSGKYPSDWSDFAGRIWNLLETSHCKNL